MALDYSAILLQLRQNRWGVGAPAAAAGQLSVDDGAGGGGADNAADVPSTTAGLLVALSEQSRHVNLLEEDEDWLPVTLEFFLQVGVEWTGAMGRPQQWHVDFPINTQMLLPVWKFRTHISGSVDAKPFPLPQVENPALHLRSTLQPALLMPPPFPPPAPRWRTLPCA